MTALLAAIVVWLSANFGLPKDENYPQIVFASKDSMTRLAHREVGAEVLLSGDAADRREVVAVYDSRTGTIHLPDDWSGETDAEVSILVHEMVHHLQHRGGLAYACPQQRDALAYKAQAAWIGMSESDLSVAFGLDPFALLVTTHCM